MTMISIARNVDPHAVASQQPRAVATSSSVLLAGVLLSLLLALLIGAGGA